MNNFARIIIIFIAVYIIIFRPLQYAAEIQNSINHDNAVVLTKEFIDSICINKELTLEGYEMYMQKLSKTGSGFIYEVILSTGGFTEESTMHGHSLYDIADAVYGRQDDTGYYIEDAAFQGGHEELSIFTAGSTHVHDDRCYFGTAHEHVGSAASGGACYGTKISHSHSSSCYAQKICGQYSPNGTIVYYDVKFGKCPSCGQGENTGTAYNTSQPSHTYFCSYCSKTVTSTNVAATHTYYVSKCSGCGGTTSIEGLGYITGDHKTTDYNNLTCKIPAGTYYELTCSIKEGYYYNGAEETYDPKCGMVVMSIQPVYAEQAVELGKDMHYGCIATFLNGSQTVMNLSGSYVKKMGIQNITLTYQGFLYNAKNTGTLTCTAIVKTVKYFDCPECGAHYESNAAGNDPGCPICSQKLLSIKVNTLKTVYDKGEVLSIEVTAVYKDREEKVKGWTSSYNAYMAGEQKVTVRYLTQACDITVFVRSGGETACPICGGSYDKDVNSSCPYCSKVLVGIAAYTEKDEIMIGEDLPVYVIAEYKDGHYEYIQSGFEIKGFNRFVPGMQHVTLGFQGYEDNVVIRVNGHGNRINVCENSHSYLLNQDGSDPGCPYCSLMDDETLRYLEVNYDGKIIDELYKDGKIAFQSGEYVTIEVRCLKASMDRLKDGIAIKNKDEGTVICVYGGRIR